MSEEFYPSSSTSSSSSSSSSPSFQEFQFPKSTTAARSQFESFFVGEGLKSKKSRAASFMLWPSKSSLPAASMDLAAAGFYYTGKNRIIACYSCGIEISSWRHGMVDLNEYHRRSSPHCQHVLAVDAVDDNWSEAASTDFTERKTRLHSFTSSCPLQIQGQIKRFVNAGFYYTGRSDIVECGFCRGRLHALRIKDPNDSHVKFFPKCAFAAAEYSSLKSKSKKRQNVALFSETTEHLSSLKMENESLRSSVTCTICRNAPVQTLTIPCCHLVTCEECGAAVDNCPECTTQILGTVKIFMA